MRAFRSGIVAWLLLGAGCIVGTQDFTGKPCLTDEDCPAGYTCAALGSGHDTACVRISPSPGGGGTGSAPARGDDAGTGVGGNAGSAGGEGVGNGGAPDAGGPGDTGGPYYCDAVKPILDAYCVSCHTAPPSGGAPSYLRLDVYGQVGTVQGAGAQASRIVARAVTSQSMPPSSSPQPTQAELSVLSSWLAAGALECASASDADGGGQQPSQPDAGSVEVPQVVSFSEHVQPIFDAYCVSCHNHDDDQGQLELDRGRSFDALLDVARCDSSLSIVKPYDPQNSLLWWVLTAHPASCAPPMPLNTPGLQAIAPRELAVIERWISQGAQHN